MVIFLLPPGPGIKTNWRTRWMGGLRTQDSWDNIYIDIDPTGSRRRLPCLQGFLTLEYIESSAGLRGSRHTSTIFEHRSTATHRLTFLLTGHDWGRQFRNAPISELLSAKREPRSGSRTGSRLFQPPFRLRDSGCGLGALEVAVTASFSG